MTSKWKPKGTRHWHCGPLIVKIGRVRWVCALQACWYPDFYAAHGGLTVCDNGDYMSVRLELQIWTLFLQFNNMIHGIRNIEVEPCTAIDGKS